MMRPIQRLLYFLSFIPFLSNCKKDDLYTRPETLAQPIYQQLKEKGNFTNLLKVIDKAGYGKTLSAAGSWTFLAPNDDAFNVWFQENGLAGADDISAEMAAKIVRYSLIYDGESTTVLDDNLTKTGWVADAAFRRRTTYYDYVYDGSNQNGRSIKVINGNTNTGNYSANNFNNKNIPIFLSPFMKTRKLGAADYNLFYPNSTYTGFNVGPATMLEGQKDLVAENGVIHVVDKVLTAPQSIDQYINSNDRFSEFSRILSYFVTYSADPVITQRYNVLTGKMDSVYAKNYSSQLPFSPSNENYLAADANDNQKESYSILAPDNEAMTKYAKEHLLKYYPRGTTLEQLFLLNSDIVRDFIRAQSFTSTLWPSYFGVTSNTLGESTKMGLDEVKAAIPLSNGFLYEVKRPYHPSLFSSVYGSVYLDPKYSLMRRVINANSYELRIGSSAFKYTLLPISDAVLSSMGFSYDPFYSSAPFRYNGSSDGGMLKRIVESHIIDLDDINVSNISGQGYMKTYAGDYIRYNNGKLISAGTMDSVSTSMQAIPVDSSRVAINGSVFYTRGALTFTSKTIAEHIEQYGTTSTQPFYNYWQFLKANTDLYKVLTKSITGVSLGTSYTFLIPTNAQIVQAVRDKVLPGTVSADGKTVTPDVSTPEKKLEIQKFIYYHIIDKETVVPSGKGVRSVHTLLKDLAGEVVDLTANDNRTLTSLEITDSKGNIATGVGVTTSVLSNRAVIHLIDKYLNYTL